ncbi:MAG: SurA N-terminal domain-containing protein, partial [Campylobacter sp.]|nr:SurA N-terminal domain-containing protein [Campylobacter sp.]
MIKKLLFSAMICVAYAGAEVVNGVIAVVDNEPITNYELVKVQKLTGASPQAAMEILIGQKLQQSEIKRRGIAVNDAEIGARFKAIADQNKLSVDQLKTAIQREGMDYEDFKTNIRRALLEEKLYGSIFSEVQRKTTPENVKKFYTQNSSLFTTFDSITLTRY